MNVRGAGHLYRPKYRTRDGERKTAGVFWWKVGRARMSTGCRDEETAQKWALERLIEMRRGHLVGIQATALRWDDLERMLIDRWTADDRRGMLQCMARLRHLRRAFGGWRADAVTTDRITAYAVRRRAEGAAVGTVNLSLAILHRGFALAREAGRIDAIPVIHRLPGVIHRTGTVERGDLDAILAALPARYRPVIEALYWTGWRDGEILRLVWQRVDLTAHELRLDTSKSGQPRVLCYASIPPLQALLEEAHARRGFSPYVFPGRAGRPIDRTTLQKRWREACRACRLPDSMIVHDLRRTGGWKMMKHALLSMGLALGLAQPVVAQEPLATYLVTPCRNLDTRLQGHQGPFRDGETRRYLLRGATQCPVPLEARGVLVTATAVDPTGPGFLVLYDATVTRPLASSLVFQAGANAATASMAVRNHEPPGGPWGAPEPAHERVRRHSHLGGVRRKYLRRRTESRSGR